MTQWMRHYVAVLSVEVVGVKLNNWTRKNNYASIIAVPDIAVVFPMFLS